MIEPVLTKYMHVFHDEEDNQFKGTDLIVYRIITGDAKPIRKAPYRVPFALREEMESQVRDMFCRKASLGPARRHGQLRPS